MRLIRIIILSFLMCVGLWKYSDAQWQPDVRLTINPAFSFTSANYARCIAAIGMFVHVVWWDYRDGNSEIYYKRSTDTGVTWGIDTRITFNSGYSDFPSIAVSNQFVHIVWRSTLNNIQDIYYKNSVDGGLSWANSVQLTNGPGNSDHPSIVVSGQNVHVIWNYENNEIFYKSSTNNGSSWNNGRVLTSGQAYLDSPSLDAYGQNVYVVWFDRRNLNYEIYYKKSSDLGINWGNDTRLTNDTNESRFPTIAVSGLFVNVVWYDNRQGNYKIFYKNSSDGGESWGIDMRLTNATVSSYDPSISTSGQNVHVVWDDNRDGNYEIYYKRSTDSGVNWEADTRLTNSSGVSTYPSITTSGSIVHVVWNDNRSGNYEIYYKRNPTGNPIGITPISNEIPNQFQLYQNYPNPFNPTTKIKFAVSSAAWTFLSVYDALGREVAALVNEQLKPGTYETEWDASNYPSGVYYYKLSAEDYTETNSAFVATRKMVLVK